MRGESTVTRLITVGVSESRFNMGIPASIQARHISFDVAQFARPQPEP